MALDRLAVLLVDDESAVRHTLTAMLSYHRYEPLPARGGAEAVEACRERGGRVAAAVLDVRMPGMDGPATLDALRVTDPLLPCVFLTGEAGDHSEHALHARGAAAVLSKPVRLAALGEAVAAAIKSGRGDCGG